MRELNSLQSHTSCLPSSGITRRLLWFSSFMILAMGIIAASCLSYYAYQNEWAALENILDGIKHTHIPVIAENVCSKNTAHLAQQVQEIKDAPYIIEVTITDGQQELARAGKIEGLNLISRQYPVSCLAAGDKIITGMLTVSASADHIAGATASFFLLAWIKITLLLAALAAALLFYLHHSFVQPLGKISGYVEKLAPDQPAYPLLINRRVASRPDEIDALAASLNNLRAGMLEHNSALRGCKNDLQASRDLFKQVFESACEPVFWKDTRGVYRGCSRRFARLAGLDSPDAVIGKTDAELPLFSGSAHATRALEHTACAENQPAEALIKCESPEAQPLLIRVRLEPVPDAGGACRAVAGSIRDVSAQRIAESALQSFQLQFESIFELPDSGLAMLSAGKYFLRANARLSSLLGYTEAELQRKNWVELIHPEELLPDIEQFDRLLAGAHSSFDREARFLTKNGGVARAAIVVNCLHTSPGSPEQYLVSFHAPPPGSREAEMQLHMLTAAVNQIQEIIVITDPRAVIQYVNPAFTQATGYASSEVIGKTPALLRSGKHDDRFYKTLWSTITQGDVWRGRFINKKQNGELYDEEASIYPLRSNAGSITSFLAVKRDITHDLKIEHQLRQVQKMEAIGTLAGGIAHDFNNILGVIYGYAEMSMDPQETLPQISSNLQQVVSATNRAKDLIRQILTISRQTEKEAMPVTISPIVKEVIKFIRASLPSSIQIKQSLEAKNDLLLADPIQIHQLLMNLCTNAGHAMKDTSGVMEISLKNIHFTDADIQEYPLMRSGDYICLSVQDSGCGIAQENMEHIFEPYFTTKESSEGTGLGLAVVHGIVRNCGGDIRVYSEVGKGSVFNVYLPLISRDTEKMSEPDIKILTGTEHILFVDDEISLVKTSKIILERLGYTVTGMTSSEEALEAFKNKPDAFDLMITDKTMPELTGYDLVREVKAHRPDLPIILCTGVSAKTDMEKVLEMGINGLMLKPFNKRELAGIIRDVLDKKNAQKGS